MQQVKAIDVANAEQRAEDLKRLYLRHFGWQHTCNMPGSFWMWRRDFADVDARNKEWHDAHPQASPHQPYGIVTADTDMAFSMTQRCLDTEMEDKIIEG